MDKNTLETAIKVAKFELERMTHETLRPSQGFKMRTHGSTIAAVATAIRYYEEELVKLTKGPKKVTPKKED